MNTLKPFDAEGYIKHAFEIARLEAAIAGDFRNHPVAYPILARYGYMEYAADGNGYVSIDGCKVIDRCRQLIAQLSS